MNQHIKLIPVASPGVVAIGYMPESSNLLVQFDVGFTIVYEHVPFYMYQELMASHDKRRYVRKYMDNRFRKYQKTVS